MNNSCLALILTAVLLCSCTSVPVGDGSPQAARSGVSPWAARSDARRDFSDGHPQIYLVGTRAASVVGITGADLSLVENLPHNVDWATCTSPHPFYAESYATAYNREIVSLLKRTR